jgi:hypothetical protein
MVFALHCVSLPRMPCCVPTYLRVIDHCPVKVAIVCLCVSIYVLSAEYDRLGTSRESLDDVVLYCVFVYTGSMSHRQCALVGEKQSDRRMSMSNLE